jgi:hypothetical protein
MITREFEIALPSGVVGTIAPEHPFTRRAILECDYIVPVPLQLFSFCLVVFAWRKGTEVEIEAG